MRTLAAFSLILRTGVADLVSTNHCLPLLAVQWLGRGTFEAGSGF
jgi:hypothetical protein